jgi:hypothetical protein
MTKVITKNWETKFFHYDIGLFQGCTMSTILFDTTFNLLLDFIKRLDGLGYAPKGPSPLRSLRKAYADDLSIITGRPLSNQLVLNSVAEWLHWTKTMKAKPPKCRSLAAKFFSSEKDRIQREPHSAQAYSTFDPLLTIDSKPIPAIGPLSMELEDKFKFLGRFVRFDLKDGPQEALVRMNFLDRMKAIDRDLVNGLMKAWLYQF